MDDIKNSLDKRHDLTDEIDGGSRLQSQTSPVTKDDGNQYHLINPSKDYSAACQNENCDSVEAKLKPIKDKNVIHVFISWNDGTNSVGMKWQMPSCSFCDDSLNAWKEHVRNQHNASCFTPESGMVEKSSQCEETTSELPSKSTSSSTRSGYLSVERAESTSLDMHGIFRCRRPKCSKVFNKKNKLLLHEMSHNNGYVFECKKCKKSFKQQWLYKRHMLTHTQGQRCSVCHKGCKNYKCLILHKKQKHSQNASERKNLRTSSQMDQDSPKTQTKPLEAVESREINQDLTSSCSSKEEGESASNLQKEEDTNKSSEKVLSSNQDQLHRRTKNGRKVFKCNTCFKTFSARCYLRRHMLIHTEVQPCSLCWKVCKNMRSLRWHMNKAHPDADGEEKDRSDKARNVTRTERNESDQKFEDGPVEDRTIKTEPGAEGEEITSDEEFVDVRVNFQNEKSANGINSFHDVQYVVKIRDVTSEANTTMDEEEIKKEEDNSKEKTEYFIEKGDSSSKHFECNVCNKVFPLRCHMKRHSLIHTEAQKCNICHRTCKNLRSLQRHMKERHSGLSQDDDVDNEEDSIRGEKSNLAKTSHAQFTEKGDSISKHFECDVCNKVFPLRCHLKRHSLIHTEAQKCNMCYRTCKNLRSLQRHMKERHSGLSQDDDIGNEDDSTGDKESNFAKTVHISLRYPCRCTGCDKSFSLLQERIQHEKEQHDGKALECSVCFKHFSSKCHFDRHMEIHTQSQKCDICQKVCKNMRRLRMHRQTHFVGGGGVCQYCGKTFSDKSNLKTHEKIHTNDKKFKCEYCEKSYVKVSELKIHEQRHTGFQYVCMHCGYGCATKLLLQNHEAIHTGEKAHKCPECNLCFRTAGQLFNHKLQHQEKRFTCDICNKKFNWKCDLQTHKRMHLGQRVYKCNKCDKTFVDVSNKNAHMKQVHLGIKRTGHGKKGKPAGGRYNLLHRHDEEASLQETSHSEAQVVSGPRLMAPSTSRENKLPQQMVQKASGQYEGARPDNDFYSMVETLIQFSKDS